MELVRLQNQTVVFGLRMTAEEGNRITEAAKKTYRTKSSFMRAACMEATREVLDDSPEQ